MVETSITRQLQAWLDRLQEGDESARDELINLACGRLTVLTRKMLRDYPRLHQWEQTDDVSQNAALRLRKALEDIAPPTARDFFRLAAALIRRELIDLTRSYYGRPRQTDAAEQTTDCQPSGQPSQRPPQTPARSPANAYVAGRDEDSTFDPRQQDGLDETNDPTQLAAWREFHTQVDALPDKEKEVVELLWYQEMTQEEAAELLNVDKSTVKRRWRAARMHLHDALQGWLPAI